MNFICCLMEEGRYILLNPYGITPILQNRQIFGGETCHPECNVV